MKKNGDVPPLPEVMLRLEAKVEDPNVDIEEIALIIESEPILAGKLLKLSNNVFFGGGREPVEDLAGTILRLGLKMVLDLTFTLEYKEKSVIYATDVEYKNLSKEGLKPVVDFFQGADLLIFDSQYTFIEGVEKEDWGHSSTFIGVDLALEAGVKQISFFHHEPTYSDFKLLNIFEKTQKYLNTISPENNLNMFLAREGLTINMLAD